MIGFPTLYRLAMNRKHLAFNPFSDYSNTKKDKARGYMLRNELEQHVASKCERKNDELGKDLVVFSCFYRTFVFGYDKTGTMTEGVFKVRQVVLVPAFIQDEILQMVNILKGHSTHPVATAIYQYLGKPNNTIRLESTEEIVEHGLKSTVNVKDSLVENFKLINKSGTQYDLDPNSIVYTTIAVAYDNKFAGYIRLPTAL